MIGFVAVPTVREPAARMLSPCAVIEQKAGLLPRLLHGFLGAHTYHGAWNVPRVTMFDTELISANIPKPIYKFVLLNPSFGFQYLLIEKLICPSRMIQDRTTYLTH